MQILEDLTLARSVKLAGLRQQVARAPGMVTLHWASGAMGVVNVMTKNLFAVFRFRPLLVILASLWLALFCLAPLGFLFLPDTCLPAILTLVAVTTLYTLSSRHSRVSPWYAVLFPAGATLFFFSLLRSTLFTLRQGGVTWRGTFYPLSDLRKEASSPR
jgi:hypothetical protein